MGKYYFFLQITYSLKCSGTLMNESWADNILFMAGIFLGLGLV